MGAPSFPLLLSLALPLPSLWVTALIFLLPLYRKEPFWQRAAACISLGSALYVVLGLLCVQLDVLMWAGPTLRYILAVALFWHCGDVSKNAALYCGIWTVVVRDLSAAVSDLLYRLLQGRMPLPWLLPLLVWGGVLTAVALTMARWMPDNRRYHTGPKQLTSACLILCLFLGIGWLYERSMLGPDLWVGGVIMLLIQLHCATVLYLQHELFQKSAIRQDLSLLNHLWIQQKNQYDLAKENISLINQKCHDLKHQIQAMRLMFSDQQREEYFQEMEQSIRIYEILAKTGNEVLDTVLTEKSLYCEANGIQANCVADGRLLAFMDPVDLYTIFGNALDNAIECVRSFENRAQRIIDVLVYSEKQMLVIQIINPVSQALEFDSEGLPVSTKVKNGYHGFGLKSIRHTVRRYGGFLSTKVEHGCFYLQILLPIQGGTP